MGDAAELGAITTKSISLEPWEGNAAPRVATMGTGMLHAVGLQNKGVHHWMEHDLPALRSQHARVIASIWGRSIAQFAEVAIALGPASPELLALEINASCPNLEARSHMFAHDSVLLGSLVAEVVAAVDTWDTKLPVFVKLSPNVTDILEMVSAAMEHGATGVTMVNTVMGLGIDADTRRPVLGNGGGGYSGVPIKPIALRLVAEAHRAFPDVPIIGTGGISSGVDAFEMLVAGASAVGIGTASFADPTSTWRIHRELSQMLKASGAESVAEIQGTLQWPS